MAYFGGKVQDGVFQTIINEIPMHDRYIELFLGGGAIMLKKKLAKVNIGVEMDSAAASAFLHPDPGTISVLNQCGIEYLRSLIGEVDFPESTFVYCDPPYPLSTRGKTRYKYDFTEEQHIDLLLITRQLDFKIAISTYPNVRYSEILHDWRVVEYFSTDRSGKVRTEHLYMNYPPPKILHDNRYIGKNAGSRQDIKRRIARTKKRLLGWNSHERQKMLLELCADLPEFEQKRLFEQLKK